jgi:hypothetical protein
VSARLHQTLGGIEELRADVRFHKPECIYLSIDRNNFLPSWRRRGAARNFLNHGLRLDWNNAWGNCR